MTKIMKMAFLNLLRNKRRTLFNVIAIALSLAVFLIFMAMWHGEKELMYGMAVKFMAGHIQIHQQGFDESSNILPPVDITIKESSKVTEICRQNPSVENVKKRITFAAFIGDGHNSIGGLVSGLIPEDETGEVFAQNILRNGEFKGRFLEQGYEIVIGLRLAELFGVTVGDEFIITAENKFKQPNLDSFSIVGIFNTGFAYFDEINVFIPLDIAARFLGYEDDEVNVIHVKVNDQVQVEDTRKSLTIKTGHRYEIFSWQHFAPEIVAGLKTDQVSYTIIMAIMLFLMIFGLLNTMSMNVFERYREIGTMRALGFRKSEISFMFTAESIFTGLIGFVFALLLGSVANYYMATVGIEYPESVRKELRIPFIVDRFLSIPLFVDVLWCLLLAIITPAMGAVLPSMRALRKSIVDELHHIS